MAKITLDQVRQELKEKNWLVLSDKYENLTSEMTFQCPMGHKVYASWKKMRTKLECPICSEIKGTFESTEIKTKEKGKIRILALDQATYTTGFAIFDGLQLIHYGKFCVKDEEDYDEIDRDIQVREWLISMIQNWKPDYIALEGIQLQDESSNKRIQSVTVFQTLARLQGILWETAREYNVPVEICHTAKWREACGVKGKHRTDKKRSMQLLAEQWYGIKATDDEADAIGIGTFVAKLKTCDKIIENWE